jgi:hemerythrin-like metal-binding protein
MQQPPARSTAAIDVDHEELFRQLADLRAAVRVGVHSEVATTLTFVRRYVESHFALEEEAMRATGYPLYHVHRGAHGRIRREVRALEADWGRAAATPAFADSVLVALTEWFEVHVLELDAQLVRFLRGGAPRAVLGRVPLARRASG